MADADYAYLVGEASGAIVAFVILRDLDHPHGNLYLKRIAVTQTDIGLGGAFLALVLAWAFGREGVHRFWLDCFANNHRAQRVYEKLGFAREGLLREAYLGEDGVRRDLTLMALTRPQWAAQRS
jgi:RimJ/RimL family protein N-acetyltransferase